MLGQWAAREAVAVGVVFDGPAPPLAVQTRMRGCGVAVDFAGARTADDLIVELIEAAPSPAEYIVVSSDHAIQHAARYHRAEPIDSQDFMRRLLGGDDVAAPGPDDATQPDNSRDPEKPDTVSEAEVEEWLRRFGGETNSE
jgi:hypothetical protein